MVTKLIEPLLKNKKELDVQLIFVDLDTRVLDIMPTKEIKKLKKLI